MALFSSDLRQYAIGEEETAMDTFSLPLRSPSQGHNPVQPPDDQLFRHMVESVSDYDLRTGPGRHGRSSNRGAEQIKGYAAAEIVGRSFELFYPNDAIDRQFPRYELEVAARDGRFEDEGWRIRKDGFRFWARVVMTARRDDAGGLTGLRK
jgi:PAS domain S-box-containing protein